MLLFVVLLLVVEVMGALGTLKVAVTEGTLSLLLSLAIVVVASLPLLLLLLVVVVVLLLSLGVVIV